MRDFTFYRRRGYVDIHLAFQAPAAQWTFTGFSSTDPRLPSHLHREGHPHSPARYLQYRTA